MDSQKRVADGQRLTLGLVLLLRPVLTRSGTFFTKKKKGIGGIYSHTYQIPSQNSEPSALNQRCASMAVLRQPQ